MTAEGEVEKLAVALEGGPFRADFSQDADEAMAAASIDASQIPRDFIETLKTLSHGELNAIARTTKDLRAKGMQDETSLMRMPL